MGKVTKRERKFAAKGGVKAGLEKGTITNKGKFKTKRKGPKQQQQSKADDAAHALKLEQQRTKERDDKDFVGKANLGLMDVEAFFSSFQEEVENEDENSLPMENSDDSSDDEDDVAEQVVKKSEKGATVKANKEMTEDDSSDDEDVSKQVIKKSEKGATVKANKKKAKKSKKSKKEEEEEDVDDDDDSSDSSNDDDDDDDDSKSSSSSSSDEDENLSDVEEQMKAEMKKLEKSDPEFHEYLQENEQELLEFGRGDDDEGEDDDEDEDDDEKQENKSDKTKTKRKLLTGKLLRSLENGAFELHGLNSLKKIIRAYKSACHLGEAADGEDSKHIHDTTLYYQIDSSDVFDQLMVTCLTKFHTALSFHLLEESEEEPAEKKTDSEKEMDPTTDMNSKMDDNPWDKPLDATVLERADRWYDIQPILQSFLKSTIYLLSESKEPKLWTYILKALSKYMRFVTPFPRIAEQLLKRFVDLWSAPYSNDSAVAGEYQLVRLHAFLRIRQLAVTQPFPFMEECLKKTYLAYARRAKFGNSLSASDDEDGAATLVFLGNCLVELYNLDLISSYQHAFIYIRQLALLIRAAMHKKTKETFQQVYCWQFVQCLKLWTAVLAAAAASSSQDNNGERDTSLIKSLIFPLSEIIIGMIRLVPAPARHLPLRFHCVRMLQQLAASAEAYIPTSALLLEVLDYREFYSKPKKIKGRSNTTQGGIQLAYILKLNKDDPLRTKEEQDACISCLFQLLNREIDLYRYSAGFPEFVIYIGQRLRKFSKETRNSRWRAYARGSLDQCDRYSKWAVQERSKLAIAPKYVPNLEILLPKGGKTMRERFEAQVAKEQQHLQQQHATTTPGSENSNKRKQEAEDDTEKDKAKGKKKKKNTKMTVADGKATSTSALNEKEVMEMEDTVEEGINWSDDEE